MIEKPLKISPDTTVEQALKQLKKDKSGYAVIVNDNGTFEGILSAKILMKHLLPVSVNINDGSGVDVSVNAAPGIAKRLKKVEALPVSNFMQRKVNFILPESPTWEGISMIITKGDPLIVVQDEDLKFLGLITHASALDDLQKIEAS